MKTIAIFILGLSLITCHFPQQSSDEESSTSGSTSNSKSSQSSKLRNGCPNSKFSLDDISCKCPAIQSGSHTVIYWQTGSFMEIGSGDRNDVIDITFKRPFCNVPTVVVSLTGLDTNSSTSNTRVQISANSVTKTGFKLNIHTWADTKIYLVSDTYIAYA